MAEDTIRPVSPPPDNSDNGSAEPIDMELVGGVWQEVAKPAPEDRGGVRRSKSGKEVFTPEEREFRLWLIMFGIMVVGPVALLLIGACPLVLPVLLCIGLSVLLIKIWEFSQDLWRRRKK